ncbi:hypothetical protein [Winogradskyella sp.]|uniref:hypothetical protein n=1 Tax=Winogradskyella sp. TaxID=1883156 RepID=UPI0026026FB3|nr:hypothetical protein [Winogradskyella sp.]
MMKIWLLYVFLVSFAVYWASNLILWFPWSVSEVLGMTLMLTVSPVIWAYSTYQSLRTYPFDKPYHSAIIVSLFFLVVSVVFDYIFFGHIRGAMEELYHPTTFYGYGFVLSVPFLAIAFFGKSIRAKRKDLSSRDLRKVFYVGLMCFLSIALILLFEKI